MVGRTHLNPFSRYPRSTWAGLTALAFALGCYLASFFISTDDPLAGEILLDLSGLMTLLALWVLLIITIIVERRKKYAALFLLLGGLFLLTATGVAVIDIGLPFLAILIQ